MNLKTLVVVLISACFFSAMKAQELKDIDSIDVDTLSKKQRKKLVDSLTYETASGLPIAASKIYFTDSKFTISGFFESNYINYRGPKNTDSGDLELYQTNLQRFVTYAAYKPKDWLVIYAEIFAEFVNDGTNESEWEYLPEFFLDFLISKEFNVRVGTHQPQIGYINNNDEPIMFYSVNRPEVERLIIPSQWIDLGLMTYGNIGNDLKWSLSAYQGLDANNLNGATWIRGGREDALRFNLSNMLINSSLKFTGIKNTEIGLNGLYTKLGSEETLSDQFGNERKVDASTYLLSSYVRHEIGDWSFMGLASYGETRGTRDLFELTSQNNQNGEILGNKVFGYYAEVGYDILPVLGLNKRKAKGKSDNFLIKANEMKLPVFVRYERLDTHAGVSNIFNNSDLLRSDLNVVTIGANFNPRRSIVIKANYQIRDNDQPLFTGDFEGNRFEIGVGFIF